MKKYNLNDFLDHKGYKNNHILPIDYQFEERRHEERIVLFQEETNLLQDEVHFYQEDGKFISHPNIDSII